MTLPALDSFTVANNPLDPTKWSTGSGYSYAWQSWNGYCLGTTNQTAASFWNADVFDSDHYVEADLSSTIDSSPNSGPAVRIATTGGVAQAYYLAVSTTAIRLNKQNGATRTAIGSDFSYATQVGDTLRLEAEGSTLRLYINGTLQSTTGWTDSALTGGAPGFAGWSSQTHWDNFRGNNVATAPAPTISGIDPVSGDKLGGTAITITGTNFSTGATVTLDGESATTVVVVSATSITAFTPDHAVGAVNVVVTNDDSQTATLTNGYTYVLGPLDQYGGYTSIPVAGGATGHFRVAKAGNRWVLVTPEGNAFWMRGCYYIDTDDSHTSYSYADCDAHEATECPHTHGWYVVNQAGYPDTTFTWGPAQLRRLKRWGFNAVAEGGDARVYPWATDARWTESDPPSSQPVKVPALPFYIYGAYYPLFNEYLSDPGARLLASSASCPKDIALFGGGLGYTEVTDIGHLPDVFDPAMRTWIDARLATTGFASYFNSPFCLGWSYDDVDYIRGFGAGPDFQTSPTLNKTAPHISWIVAAGAGYQAAIPLIFDRATQAAIFGTPYTNTQSYSKEAWRTYIKDTVLAEYSGDSAKLAALNTRWNTSGFYTTWDSTGVPVVDEDTGLSGDGSTLTFDFTLDNIPSERSLVIKVGGRAYATDTNGVLYGAHGASTTGTVGTVLYTTAGGGAVHLAFTASADNNGTTVSGSNVITTATAYKFRVGDTVTVSAGFATAGPYTVTGVAANAASITIDATATSTITDSTYMTVTWSGPATGEAITVSYVYNGWNATTGAPVGTGFMDENGKHAWFGTYSHSLANCNANLATDLNGFLYVWSKKYFDNYHDALVVAGYHSHTDPTQSKIIFGPTVVGTWGSPARPEIMQAAGESLDIIRTGIDVLATDFQDRFDFAMQYFGDKPYYMGCYLTANLDSMLFAHQRAAGMPDFATQELRGARYAQLITQLLDLHITGQETRHSIGLSWWQYSENYPEFSNFGLVTLRDNAYDGVEARIATSTDTLSVPGTTLQRGGEVADYGDAITAITNANASVFTTLQTAPLGSVRLSVR